MHDTYYLGLEETLEGLADRTETQVEVNLDKKLATFKKILLQMKKIMTKYAEEE